MSEVATAIESALSPLDLARRATLALLGRRARRLVIDRELRVAVLGLLTVGTSLAGAVWAPLWLLALGPIIFGVPHLLADVRYLVARPRLHARPELLLALGIPLVATALRPQAWVGLLAAVGAVACARSSLVRRSIGFAAVSAAYALAWRFPRVADLAMVHLHNAVAVVLWWAWRPRRMRAQLPVVALFLVGSALLLVGAFHPNFAGPASANSVLRWMNELAPGTSLQLGFRWVACFAFAQSVHYGLWLRLVPDDDRARPTPRSFRTSFRALRDDLGMPLLAISAVLALGLAIWGAADLAAARDGYLRFSAFHAYLEVAALALCWTEARRPGEIAG